MCCSWVSLCNSATCKTYLDWCFLMEQTGPSECSHHSSGVEWKGLPLNPMHLGLCIQICSQVQTFVKLVQESWLALVILVKALQKHYVNTLTPARGENAACGCMARSCCVSAAHCNFLSSDLYLSPSWKTPDCFPPRAKVLLGDYPQGNFHEAMNVPPGVLVHSFFCFCSRCEAVQGCLTVVEKFKTTLGF